MDGKHKDYTRRTDSIALPTSASSIAKHLRKILRKHKATSKRLNKAFELLGEPAKAKLCKAMEGLVAEGEETIEEGQEKEALAADLALITSAQKVEHYEISGYGTLREFARQIGELEVFHLLTHTLGEEETADSLLSEVAKPIIQQATSEILEAKTG